jgi:prepilin-type N-terminal cleavage/methylation domain-containing protein
MTPWHARHRIPSSLPGTGQAQGREDRVKDHSRGFTLIELLIVMVVAGILGTMAVTNYGALQKRAREASTKSNMHAFQIATEDYGVRNGSTYPTSADQAAALLTQGGNTFYNPFFKTTGSGQAWVDQATWARPLTSGSTRSGIVAYGDSVGTKYQICGRGASADLTIILSSGS